ncbi:hypothetical protein [Corynebacterium cystitidis]|uniref:Uncharacterized protein n=1 Tax=Corynebacterium cystitidis DSM 20524 TaxID=1121357 RepID=A0A1H9TST3_9CORY|nr:hypothetical protein [Corynebacterium cystitidis]WJY81969.1 hypothetical protein CCYS_05130 [Corynebacterium cystitidis DSM 20524]SES00104.1 hypothetical protein SAMN05661109_01536 [Corynebacterium cystitidis DSM 20524]SNV81430.1 Uncharacterised protein [Corynebacterium cystitidis]
MGFLDSIRLLLGAETLPRLVGYPDELAMTEVDTLEVHTAHITPDTKDILVIVTLDARAFRLAKNTTEPLRMTCGDNRAVTWIPVRRHAIPALDPTVGWIIPLTDATRAELSGLADDTTEVELNTVNVGIVVT